MYLMLLQQYTPFVKVYQGNVMKRAALAVLLCISCETEAAFEHLTQGSSVIAMGGAATATLDNPWAAFSSPGTLSSISDRVVSLYYSPQPFGLKELAHGSFTYVEKSLSDISILKPKLSRRDPLALELDHFIQCVREGKTPLVSGKHGRDALELAGEVLANLKIHA